MKYSKYTNPHRQIVVDGWLSEARGWGGGSQEWWVLEQGVSSGGDENVLDWDRGGAEGIKFLGIVHFKMLIFLVLWISPQVKKKLPSSLSCTEDWWPIEGWKGRNWPENWVQPAGGMWKEGHGPGFGPSLYTLPSGRWGRGPSPVASACSR